MTFFFHDVTRTAGVVVVGTAVVVEPAVVVDPSVVVVVDPVVVVEEAVVDGVVSRSAPYTEAQKTEIMMRTRMLMLNGFFGAIL